MIYAEGWVKNIRVSSFILLLHSFFKTQLLYSYLCPSMRVSVMSPVSYLWWRIDPPPKNPKRSKYSFVDISPTPS